MSKVSEAEIKPCRVTPIHRHCCYTHTHTHTHKQTHTNLNTPSSVEGRRLTEWARDYWRDGFPVWTSDEANVNSVHVEGRDQEKRG